MCHLVPLPVQVIPPIEFLLPAKMTSTDDTYGYGLHPPPPHNPFRIYLILFGMSNTLVIPSASEKL